MSDWASAAAVLANKTHSQPNKPAPSNSKPFPSRNDSTNISSASAKAALLAHKAALSNQATSSSQLSENAAQESLKDARKKALLAATKSMRDQKVDKNPPVSQAPSRDAELASRRITARQQETQSRHEPQKYQTDIIHIRPEMLTEHPPLRMEVEEKRHNEALHASALSLARTVYNNQRAAQQKQEPTAKEQAKQYVSLQDAAQKLAAERIAKINDSTNNLPVRSQSTRTKTTNLLQRVRKGHRRTASDGEDAATAGQNRRYMASLCSSNTSADSKRDKDQVERSRIMAAAERKVQAQMQTLDATVFAQTGKMSPAMMSDWDSQSRARRAENSQIINMRETQTNSAVDVGAGKIVDRAEVNRLAEQRVGPTLKGIDEAVERRKTEEKEKKERIEEEKKFLKEERGKRKQEKVEQKRHDEAERKEQKIRDQQIKAGTAIAILAQPSSIREREELEAERRQKQQAKAGSAVQGIVSAEAERDQKIRDERAKAAAALEGIVQTQEERDQRAKEQKLQAGQALEQIAQGSPLTNSREVPPEVQRAKAGSAVQEIVDAEIQRELKDKNQKIKASKTLGEIAQGEALFASHQKEQKEERKGGFSILRRKSRRPSDPMEQKDQEVQKSSVTIVPLPEIERTIPLGLIDPPPETENPAAPVERSATPVSAQPSSRPTSSAYETKPEKKRGWFRNRNSESPSTGDSKFVDRNEELKQKENVQEARETKEHKPSRLKSAFDKLKRRSGGAVLIHKNHNNQDDHQEETVKRQDGDSTDLEDSSDDASFHSTQNTTRNTTSVVPAPTTEDDDLYAINPALSAIPEPSILSSNYPIAEASTASSTAEPNASSQTPSITVIGVTELNGQVPIAKPVLVPGDDESDGDRSDSGRRDPLSGLHLPTRFKEQL